MEKRTQVQPVWMTTATGPIFPPLRGNLNVDVAIVGGGITGLTAAALLAEGGQRVALLEARRLGGGVSGHTTAHLDWSTDTGPRTLVSKFGQAHAKLTLEAGLQAIERIAAWVDHYAIHCDFHRVDGFYFTEREDDLKELEEEAEAARQLGLAADWVRGRIPLPFPVAGAVRYADAGRLHPLKYLYALADLIAGDHCQIYEQTRVHETEDGTPCRLGTEHGQVLAREIVLATHSPLGLRFAIHTRVAPYRSYVLGVRVNSPVPEGIFFDNVDPYHYLRRFSDEDDRLLLVGGADHKTGQREDTEACFQELEDYARQRFTVREVEYRWSAQVFVPVDDLPYIGLDVGDDHTYIATGYAGTGITLGTFAGMLIADQILGRANPAAELFSPRRVHPVSSASKFMSENLNVAHQYVSDWMRSWHSQNLAELPAGQGVVIELNGNKLAVYRDEQGRLHKFSAVCPHAKCIVHWNPAEMSWDCPCHGSRFEATGHILDAPTQQGLERIE